MSALLESAQARLVSQKAALAATRASLKEAREKKWNLAIKHLSQVEKRQAAAVSYTEALLAEVSNAKA